MIAISIVIILLMMTVICLEVGQIADYTRERSEAVKVIMLIVICLLLFCNPSLL
jgi:MFS-type transporter involved in bile tolerance (Atg22 family)